MSVSVIIVNWNSGNLLKKCVRHLLVQTILPERVFVLDNDSTDNSEDIQDVTGKVTVIKMPTNKGFAAGNNRALSECKTPFIALLNPDAFPEPDWIEQMLKAARKYPESAAFGSRQLSHDNRQQIDGTGDCYHMSGLVWRNHHGMRQQPADRIACEIFSPCAAGALYRRKALLDVGGFDEDYFCYSEDVDLGFRLRLAGYRAMYVPDAIVYHVGSATTGGQQSDFSVYHGHRNLVWTFVKDMPGPLFWILLPLHLLLNLVSIVVFATRGQFRVIMKSKWDAIKALRHAWAKRRKIQKSLDASIYDIWQALDHRLIRNKRI